MKLILNNAIAGAVLVSENLSFFLCKARSKKCEKPEKPAEDSRMQSNANQTGITRRQTTKLLAVIITKNKVREKAMPFSVNAFHANVFPLTLFAREPLALCEEARGEKGSVDSRGLSNPLKAL